MNAKELRQHHGTRMHVNARQARLSKVKPTATQQTPASSSTVPKPLETVGTSTNYQYATKKDSHRYLSPADTDTRAPPVAGSSELPDMPPDGVSDSCDEVHPDLNWGDPSDSGAHFSAGETCHDPMAESLARALRDAGIGGNWQGDDERPLHEEEDSTGELDDPFYCEGMSTFRNAMRYLCHVNPLPGPNIDAKSSHDLLAEWFGASSDGEWFPYPDKAVRSFYEWSRNILMYLLAVHDRLIV